MVKKVFRGEDPFQKVFRDVRAIRRFISGPKRFDEGLNRFWIVEKPDSPVSSARESGAHDPVEMAPGFPTADVEHAQKHIHHGEGGPIESSGHVGESSRGDVTLQKGFEGLGQCIRGWVFLPQCMGWTLFFSFPEPLRLPGNKGACWSVCLGTGINGQKKKGEG